MFYSWQILKCNLKFVPVSNLIESPLHRLPRVHWGTIKILLRLQLKNISDQRTELFHFFSPKLDQTAIMMIISKYFQFWSEIWKVKMREILFSRQETKTQTELSCAGLVSVCVYISAASCLSFSSVWLQWGVTRLSVWRNYFNLTHILRLLHLGLRCDECATGRRLGLAEPMIMMCIEGSELIICY